MLALAAKLLQWNVLRNWAQTLIMVLAIFGSLSSYVLLGTALTEMSGAVAQVMRSDWPFDLTVSGIFSDEEQQSIAELAGIYHLEVIGSSNAYVLAHPQTVITLPEEGSRLIVELSAGNLPTDEREVALPGDLALQLQLEVGDQIELMANHRQAVAETYAVSGILSTKSGVLKTPLITESGLQRLLPTGELTRSLLIQLDGKADLERMASRIRRGFPQLTVTIDAAGYEQMQSDFNMSDALVMGLRGLILIITAASLAVLFYISQRSGSFQTGVLRAIGVKKPWLLLPALLQTLLIFAIGFGLTALVLPNVAMSLGLLSSRAMLLTSLRQDMGLYLLVGLISTLVVNLQFLGFSIPRLLKDAW